MNPISTPAELVDFGRAVGQRRALNAVAGRCSAAHADILRKIRNQKLYLARAHSWEEFCSCQVRISRRHADRIIALLDEFGPAFFELSQLTGITPEKYRAIHPVITAQRLANDPESISYVPDNVEAIIRAIDAILAKTDPPPKRAHQRPSTAARLDRLTRRGARLAASFRRILARPTTPPDRALALQALQQTIDCLTAIQPVSPDPLID